MGIWHSSHGCKTIVFGLASIDLVAVGFDGSFATLHLVPKWTSAAHIGKKRPTHV